MSAPCPVFGFEARLEITPLDDDERRALWEALEAEVLAPRGLKATSLAFGTLLSFAVSSEASQATDSDRHAVDAWLRTRREVVLAELGPLIDLASVA